MAVVSQNEDDMKFFNRSKNNCKDICQLYKAPKTVTSEGVINQFKCMNCDQYIFPNGIKRNYGTKICRCCGNPVAYIESITDDPDLKTTKKIISKSFTKQTFGRKTFDEFLDFIEVEIQLQANYQLVVLKFLIGSKMSEKMKIAEELAYQNNKNYNDHNEVKKFLSVPVYGVLENRGFIKKIIHDDEEQYMLNIEMTNFEATRSLEIIEKKLIKYNVENNIPENQFDSISNDKPLVVTEYPKIKTEVNESTDEKIVFLENSSNGIILKEYVETKSEEIHKGQILSNDDLINKFSVGNMGGIRYSKKNNILILCSSLSNDYDDVLDHNLGLIVYSGEGKIGDQEISKGNAKILDSKNNMLFFKEKFQESGTRKRGALDNLYEFIGIVNCVKHYWKYELDTEKNQRKVVKFVLEVKE